MRQLLGQIRIRRLPFCLVSATVGLITAVINPQPRMWFQTGQSAIHLHRVHYQAPDAGVLASHSSAPLGSDRLGRERDRRLCPTSRKHRTLHLKTGSVRLFYAADLAAPSGLQRSPGFSVRTAFSGGGLAALSSGTWSRSFH